MNEAVLLLCCVLLPPVTGFPGNVQEAALTLQPSFAETGCPPNALPNQIPLWDPKTFQDLLHTVPSLAPLPEHLSSIALGVFLEEVGCPTEAHALQLQLVRMGGKDAAETLICESKKHNKEEGIGSTKVVLGGHMGELRQPQCSVTVPEACRAEHRWALYELAELMFEFAEKLPSTKLVEEFKTSAINVTQKCTDESWEHLEAVGKHLVNGPEIDNLITSMEDELHFVKHITTILTRLILELIQKYFQTYFE